MAAYKDIIGQKITIVTSNPPEPKTGQMWYNSTDGALRGLGVTSAWRSSAPILVARDAAGSAGTQTTATIFGGNINPGNTSATDEYNGSGFSSGGALNTARRQTTGCGLQTAALCVGGYTTANAANVEEYNGTSWSEQNDIPSNSRNGSTFGTQTAALYVGGYTVPVPNSDVIQIYDGTNWTTSPATLGTGGNSISSTGTSTAGLVFGGSNRLNLTEEWNGSAMSAGGNMSTSKYGRGSANQAPSENAMSAGGGIPAQTTVENYDGTSWSTLPSLAVATNDIRGAGTATSAMMMGGGPGAGPIFNTSTEFDQSTNTITAAAWASGGNLNTARAYIHGCGLQDAALVVAGYNGSVSNTVEEYDGTSWTEQNNLGTSRYNCGTLGIQTAAIAAGGRTPPPDSGSTTVEGYDGSSWTALPSLNSARTYLAGVGTNTASLVAMGAQPRNTASNLVEEYDGSSWSAQNTNSTTRRLVGAGGVQTSAVYFGGDLYPAPDRDTVITEEYDGTNWTTGGSLSTGRNFLAGSTNAPGNTNVLAFGGQPPNTGETEGYDGTAWSTRPSLSTARHALAGGGTASAALAAGGNAPPWSNATEEFTGETETANITDFSTE